MRILLITVLSMFLFACSNMGKHKHGKKDGCCDKKAHHGHMFEKMDTDKDGFITKAEFDAAEKTHFSEMDANSDAKISPDEAKAFMKAKHQEKKKECSDCKEGKKCDKC